MKRIGFFVIICLALSGVAQDLTLRFQAVPLDMVLQQYAEWTGKRVEVVRGVNAAVTFQAEKEVSQAEAAAMVEAELSKLNIGLFPISSNRVVAAWIDTTKAPTPRTTYRERLEQRRQQIEKDVQPGVGR